MNGLLASRRATISDGVIESVAFWLADASREYRSLKERNVREIETPMSGTVRNGNAGGAMNGLLAAVAENRDRAAFQALFEFFAPRIKAFMYRQGTNPDMAEEVLQETMVNVWRKAGQFNPAKASASTWIFTIARNARIDLLRKENRPSPDLNDPALVPDPEPHAQDRISWEQEAGRLKQAVAGLPKEQREVLHLAFFEEKAHPQVADELGIPLGTVKSRIRLACKRIRAELGDSR